MIARYLLTVVLALAPIWVANAAVDPQLELRYWDDVVRMNTIEGYEAYLATFPEGTFRSLARINLHQLHALDAKRSTVRNKPEATLPAAATPAATAPRERLPGVRTPTGDTGRCVQGNCFTGRGVYEFANGDRYRGEFQGGELHGQGEYRYANGASYEGQFQAGVASGEASVRYPDGSRYVGQVNAGRMAGQGVLYLPDGRVIRGDWRRGYLRSE